MKFCYDWLSGFLRRCLKLSYFESPESKVRCDLDLWFSQIFLLSLRQLLKPVSL